MYFRFVVNGLFCINGQEMRKNVEMIKFREIKVVNLNLGINESLIDGILAKTCKNTLCWAFVPSYVENL